MLEISTDPGDVVLDPFGGSGATYAAAEEMHRHWIGIELADCEPIMRRLRGERANVLPKNRGDAAKGMREERRKQTGEAEQLALLERSGQHFYRTG